MSAPRAEEQKQLRKVVAGRVAKLWRLRPGDLIETRDMLLMSLPEVVAAFGEVAATLAADQFEEVAGRRAVLAAPTAPEAVQASTRWALTPMFSAAPDAATTLARLSDVAERNVLGQGDRTIYESASAHRMRYAWVPSGPTCGWCTMKASRGAVYHSEATAIAGRHEHCDCTAQPVATDADLTRLRVDHGYDVEGAYEAYSAAAAVVGSNPAKVAAEIDRQRQAALASV